MTLTVPASLLDAVDPRTAMADVMSRLESADPPPASLVANLVATRPVGGKRRATTTPHEHQSAGPTGGKRARRGTLESILIDAADAANHLSISAITWDATQILAHAEIARLALAEALRDLSAERDGIEAPPKGTRKMPRRKRAAAHADIQRRAAVILQAAELLAAAHDRKLVRGD